MIFCVEDDDSIRDLMIYTLHSAGFEAEGFPDGAGLLDALQTETPQLIMLDIMLPGEDGISVLKKLRHQPSTADIPVIMATAKGTEYDKVMGLDLGADDYLAKPFGMMELVSRVRALYRRAESPAIAVGGKCKCGEITLDGEARTVRVCGEPISLTLKEFDLLQMLMNNCGHVLTRDHLLESVWRWDFAGNTRTVDAHVQTLRQKIASASAEAASMVETVRGVGYVIRP